MVLVIDPYYGELGAKVAHLLGDGIIKVEHKVFPDGEYYFRFVGDVLNRNVGVIVGCFPWGQNECVIRGLFLSSTLRELGARKVVLIFPYFPYARQDKRFLPGECVSAKIVASMIKFSGVDLIATVDVHAEEVFKFLGDSFVNISSCDVWVDYFRKNYGQKFFLVAPDEGRLEDIKKLANKLNVPYTGFRKTRDLKSGEIKGLEPMNEDELITYTSKYDIAVIFDDIISTGGTAARAISLLRKFFKGKIIAAFTHGLFLPGAVEKLVKAGVSEIVCTDTVRNTFCKVSVAPLLASFLKEVL